MEKEIFREYDIRGIADTQIGNETAWLIGAAYATIVLRRGGKKIVVGRDNRKSGPRILKAMLEGIASTGLDVVFIGEVPTPLLYYAVNKIDCDGGISVTASHNPPQFNGFKVMFGKAAAYGSQIQQIFEVAKKGDFEVAKKGKGRFSQKSLDEQYMREIYSSVKPKRKLKVVVDAGNGMGSEIGPKILEKIGCELELLYCTKDPDFPNHLADPVEEKNILDLRKKVLEVKADIGIAYDGDADRIGILDESGAQIYGDQLLGIYAADMLKRNPGAKVIFEVKCSQALEEYVSALGGKPLMWKTGHSLIKAKMKEEKALLAGEMSGHMFFAENYYGFDDAFLASARIVEILANSNMKMSKLVAKMPSYASSPEYRVDFADSEKFEFVKRAAGHFASKYKIIDVDGCRVVFDDGWALVRASNTQPKIILRFEGKTKKALERIKKEFLGEIRIFSGLDIDLAR